MTDQLRQAAQQAMDFLMTRRMGAESVITALNVALALEHAMHELARLGQEIEQAKPISTNGAMRDARLNAGWGSEQQAETPLEWPLIKNILDEYGLQAISFVADWKAAQRPWVGLTEEEVKHLYPYGRSVWGKETFEAIEKALKDKNT